MKKLILSVLVVGLLAPALSLAAYWQADESVSITARQPVQGNAYVAGQSVNVSGSVRGDLFAAGSFVSVSGDVSQDIMAAGSLVNIMGVKAQDVRVGGSSVSLSGEFSGELLAAGSSVIVDADTRIAQDVHIAGSLLNFNGVGAGEISLFGDKVEFNGRAGGDLTVKSRQALVIGPDAVIAGDLNYTSSVEASIDPAARISGKVNFIEAAAGESRDGRGARAALAGVFTVFFLIKLLAILLAAYLLWYLRGKDAVEITQQSLSKFGASLLRGFIFLVVVPAGMIVLMFTLIGVPIAIFSGLVYAAMLMLACPFAVLLAASLLMKKRTDLRWYHILLGAVVLAILNLVPVIGWLAVFIVYLASLGSLVAALRTKFMR